MAGQGLGKFTFRTGWAAIVKGLPAEVRLEVWDALSEYAMTGNVPEMGETARVAFEFIKLDIDEEAARREATAAKRREAARRRWESKAAARDEAAAAAQGGAGGPAPAHKPSAAKRQAEGMSSLFGGESGDEACDEACGMAAVGQAARKQQKRASPFKPPSPDEVRAYCARMGYGIDPDMFINFYESKGWMVGNNKMRDWQAACRTWARRHSDDNDKYHATTRDIHGRERGYEPPVLDDAAYDEGF